MPDPNWLFVQMLKKKKFFLKNFFEISCFNYSGNFFFFPKYMWKWNSHIFANHCLWKEHNVTVHMYDGILCLEKKIKASFKTTKPK